MSENELVEISSDKEEKLGSIKPKWIDNRRPGRLINQVELSLHTASAQILFSGSLSSNSVGLLQFGGYMNQLMQAAEEDDPYADWYLLKVYDGLTRLRHRLTALLKEHEPKLLEATAHEHLKLAPFLSEKPLVKRLYFGTPYGYLGALLVADFDRLMSILLTSSRVGVIFDRSHEVLRDELAQEIGELFRLPSKWQSLKITRQDVINNNELAQDARIKMGTPPKSILEKTLRSPFAPKIKTILLKDKPILPENTQETASDE